MQGPRKGSPPLSPAQQDPWPSWQCPWGSAPHFHICVIHRGPGSGSFRTKRSGLLRGNRSNLLQVHPQPDRRGWGLPDMALPGRPNEAAAGDLRTLCFLKIESEADLVMPTWVTGLLKLNPRRNQDLGSLWSIQRPEHDCARKVRTAQAAPCLCCSGGSCHPQTDHP